MYRAVAVARQTYKVGNDNILGRKPSDDAEVTQSRHKKTRQEIECDSSQEDAYKEFRWGDCPTIGRLVLVLVERCEHGSGDKRTGPNHAAWPDKVLASKASKCISKDLGGQSKENLIGDAKILMVELCLFDNDLVKLAPSHLVLNLY